MQNFPCLKSHTTCSCAHISVMQCYLIVITGWLTTISSLAIYAFISYMNSEYDEVFVLRP